MKIINLNQDKSKKNKYFSNTLLKEIEKSLKNGKKIILYLNKRGNYSSLICENCNKIFKCKNCDSSLAIHGNNMICHICGFIKKIQNECDNCKSKKLEKIGVGTKQVENSLKDIFKNVNIFRLDTDTIKNITDKKNALNKLKNAEIIIGTKMITTGFDFQNIGVVGVILLEQELLGNKYNTEEKLYSNIKQLLGRGGRKGEKTNFLIQTFIPTNGIIEKITKDNYKNYFLKTIEERKLFKYPPFAEFITLEYRNKDKQKAFSYTQKLKEKLDKNNIGGNIEIIFSKNPFKKYNSFHYKIILKGKNLRNFLNCIKYEIFKDKNLVVIFE